jgi:hypothetical protein
MDNTNLTQSIGVINPKAKRYKAYDIVKERYINYTNQYGRTAKRLYKQYIGIGHDAEMVTPNNLKYYPDSGRFYKQKPQKEKPPKFCNNFSLAYRDINQIYLYYLVVYNFF